MATVAAFFKAPTQGRCCFLSLRRRFGAATPLAHSGTDQSGAGNHDCPACRLGRQTKKLHFADENPFIVMLKLHRHAILADIAAKAPELSPIRLRPAWDQKIQPACCPQE